MSNNPFSFLASNLAVPTMAGALFKKLTTLVPSMGPGSGALNQQRPDLSNAQWIRRFSIVVYATGSGPSTTTPVTTNLAFSQPGLLRPRAPGTPFARSWRIAPRMVALPDSVTPSDAQAQPMGGDQLPGIDLSNLRCDFKIEKQVADHPNRLYARIYNMKKETMQQVLAFHRVQVSAGYVYGDYGCIFDGEVVQYVRGKENPVDTFFDIFAGDFDHPYNGGTTFKAIPPGKSEGDLLKELDQSDQEAQLLTKASTVRYDEFSNAYQRYRVIAGRNSAVRRQIAQHNFQDIWSDNGVLTSARRNGYLKNEAVVLSPQTGLVSIPEVTPQGIQIRCLLNPNLRLGGLVKIESKWLSGVAYIPGPQASLDEPVGGQITSSARPGETFEHAYTSPTGTYKILMMNYSGDTRGNPWYCDLICIALDGSGNVMINPSSALTRSNIPGIGPGNATTNTPPPQTGGNVVRFRRTR